MSRFTPGDKQAKKMFQILMAALFVCFVAMDALADDDEENNLRVTRMEWQDGNSELSVSGLGAGRRTTVTMINADSGAVIGSTTSRRDGRWGFRKEHLLTAPCLIQVRSSNSQSTTAGYTGSEPTSCGDTPTSSEGSHAGRITTYEGTATCLACHEREAQEVHDSVHYQWQGDASETIGLNTSKAGKLGGINDFCIYPDINWIGKLTNTDGIEVDGGCAKCHVGLGEKPTAENTAAQLANIDCLICHSDAYKRKVEMVNGVYKFVPDLAKMTVSIDQAAADITLPSKDSCLNCHTKAGGGDNFKRGDIEEAHRNPSRSFDVHMAARADGGAGLNCLDCHVADGHKIAGRGSDLRPRESSKEVSCTQCHGDTPHGSRDINKHTARVNCTVCHIPYFAKVAPTDMNRNWSDPNPPLTEKGLYEPAHEKGTNVIPVYRFFNGMSTFYQFGDAAEPGPDGRIVMSAPIGDIHDPGAKIFAFKKHLATQPVDLENGRLLPLKIGKFFMTGQIDEAVKLGAEAVGWNYNGHSFADTERYLGLFHEVAPQEDALNCSSCHNGGTRLNFAALGYTPKETRNGRRLCASCHGDESDEWSDSELFSRVHEKHVDDEGYNCNQCHTFDKAN